MAAIQPVLCKHGDLVERILLLPEAEGHYFDGGRLYKHELENKLEEMNVDDEGAGGGDEGLKKEMVP